MGRCEMCMTNPANPDKKCCFNCARANTDCQVWHNCGEDCPGWEGKVVTNADKIRSMSDRELLAFLVKYDVEQNRLRMESCGIVPTATQLSVLCNTLQGVWWTWLQQPAEVEK